MDPEALQAHAGKHRQQASCDFLDQLPPDPAGQIKSLSDYDFMDDEARQEFQELLQMLQQQVMQQYFQGMQQAIQNMSPEDLARMREMVRELNQMLRERAEGNEPDFDSFMQKYGDFFGPGINILDDLVEQMQRAAGRDAGGDGQHVAGAAPAACSRWSISSSATTGCAWIWRSWR